MESKGNILISRHGLLLKGVALFVHHDEEFDFTAMCCLCSMLMYQPQALSLNGLEMSSLAVLMVTVQGNVNVIEYIS